MRIAGIIIGILLALAGTVWLAQGLNLSWAPASFMTADRTWVLIGSVTMVIGIGLAVASWRRTPS